jgi:hypothetical protein
MKRTIDAPIAQLILDLEQRGLLEKTLVVVATKFGRDMMTEGKPGLEVKNQVTVPEVMTETKHYGMHRQLYGRCASVLAFGGGIRKGFVYGRDGAGAGLQDDQGSDRD